MVKENWKVGSNFRQEKLQQHSISFNQVLAGRQKTHNNNILTLLNTANTAMLTVFILVKRDKCQTNAQTKMSAATSQQSQNGHKLSCSIFRNCPRLAQSPHLFFNSTETCMMGSRPSGSWRTSQVSRATSLTSSALRTKSRRSWRRRGRFYRIMPEQYFYTYQSVILEERFPSMWSWGINLIHYSRLESTNLLLISKGQTYIHRWTCFLCRLKS